MEFPKVQEVVVKHERSDPATEADSETTRCEDSVNLPYATIRRGPNDQIKHEVSSEPEYSDSNLVKDEPPFVVKAENDLHTFGSSEDTPKNRYSPTINPVGLIVIQPESEGYDEAGGVHTEEYQAGNQVTKDTQPHEQYQGTSQVSVTNGENSGLFERVVPPDVFGSTDIRYRNVPASSKCAHPPKGSHESRPRTSRWSERPPETGSTSRESESGICPDGLYHVRGRLDEGSGSSSVKRKRDKSSESQEKEPAKRTRDISPTEALDIFKFKTYDFFKYKKIVDKTPYRHLDVILKSKERTMVEKHYRSLQKQCNWEFYTKNIRERDRVPNYGYVPPFKKVYEDTYGCETDFDDCRLSRRTFICPFCPSHSYCFNFADRCPVKMYYNSCKQLCQHILNYHYPFNFFVKCDLCDECQPAQSASVDTWGRNKEVPNKYPHHMYHTWDLSDHLLQVHIQPRHMRKEAEAIQKKIDEDPLQFVRPPQLNRFYIPPLYPTRLIESEYEYPVVRMGEFTFNIRMFKDSPMNVPRHGPKQCDRMADIVKMGKYPRHLRHHADQAAAFVVPIRTGRTQTIRDQKIDFNCLYRRDFNSESPSDKKAMTSNMNRAIPLGEEVEDSDTQYHNIEGPLGDVRNPVVATDPASTTGPLIQVVERQIHVTKLPANVPAFAASSVPSNQEAQEVDISDDSKPSTSSGAIPKKYVKFQTTPENCDSEIRENPKHLSIFEAYSAFQTQPRKDMSRYVKEEDDQMHAASHLMQHEHPQLVEEQSVQAVERAGLTTSQDTGLQAANEALRASGAEKDQTILSLQGEVAKMNKKLNKLKTFYNTSRSSLESKLAATDAELSAPIPLSNRLLGLYKNKISEEQYDKIREMLDDVNMSLSDS